MGNNLGEISSDSSSFSSAGPCRQSGPGLGPLIDPISPRQIPSSTSTESLFPASPYHQRLCFRSCRLTRLLFCSFVLQVRSSYAISHRLTNDLCRRKSLGSSSIDSSFVARLRARKRVVCMKVGEEGKGKRSLAFYVDSC